MDSRLFKRLLITVVFSIVFIMIAKVFLGKTIGYLTEAAEKKRQTAAAQAVSAPVAASSVAESAPVEADAADDAEPEEVDPAAPSRELADYPVSMPAPAK